MEKQDEIRRVNSLVYDVLVEDPKARDSDEYLVAKILEKVLDGHEKEYKVIYLLENFSKVTGFHIETVRRTRQKLQRMHPEIYGSRKITECRKKCIAAFIKYAKGNK